MDVLMVFSLIVGGNSRNFNSLKVLNYRQIEKRILDRILSPSIYDNQIRRLTPSLIISSEFSYTLPGSVARLSDPILIIKIKPLALLLCHKLRSSGINYQM